MLDPINPEESEFTEQLERLFSQDASLCVIRVLGVMNVSEAASTLSIQTRAISGEISIIQTKDVGTFLGLKDGQPVEVYLRPLTMPEPLPLP